MTPTLISNSSITYESEAESKGVSIQNKTLYIEVPSASSEGQVSIMCSDNQASRYAYIYKTNGTVKDNDRKIVMQKTTYPNPVYFTSSDIKTEGGKYYLVFSTTDDFKYKQIKFTLFTKAKYTTSTFYPLYASTSKTAAQLISAASFHANIDAPYTTVANANGYSSAVENPYNFKDNITSGTTYYYINPGSTSQSITLYGLSNVKSIRMYGNGTGGGRTFSVTVKKVSGTGSEFTVSNITNTNAKTIVEQTTGDLTALTGYDADTYYTYTITCTSNNAGHLWGIYVEARAAAGCANYSFHYGTTKGSEDQMMCFSQVGSSTTYITEEWTIPSSDQWTYVGWQGGWHNDNAKSANLQLSSMRYGLDHSNTLGSISTNVMEGAKGYVQIYSDNNESNRYVGFVPSGYILRRGTDSDGWTSTAFIPDDADDVMEDEWTTPLTSFTADNADHFTYVGLKTASGYVWTNRSETRRPIFLKPNDTWKNDNAKFVMYYWDDSSHSGYSAIMTDPDGDGVYEAWIPNTYSYNHVLFGRLNPVQVDPVVNWDNKWNKTTDQSLPSDKNLFEITGGSDQAFTGSWSVYGSKGKFHIWSSSNTNNWYCQYYPHYVLTYDANGGSGEPSAQSVPVDGTSSERTVDVAAGSGMTPPTGYTFAGWNPDEDDADAGTIDGDYDPSDNVTLSADMTLYAVWSPKEYTIILDDESATTSVSPSSVTVTYNSSTIASITNPSKTGYTFGGWYSGDDGTGTLIIDTNGDLQANTAYTGAGGIWTNDDDVTLYALWTANTYSVTHTLSNVTTKSGATGANAATYGTAYTATFRRARGYNLPTSVTVTAGESDITDACTWTSSTGTLTIPAAQLTGNIVITVTGTAVTCPDGSSAATLFSLGSVGSGYSNSSDSETELTNITVTGGFAYGYGTSSKTLSYASNKIKYAGGVNYIKLVLDCDLQEGDIISFSCDSETGLNFNSDGNGEAAGDGAYATGALYGSTYTIVADDGLESENTIYCWRRTDNGTNVTAITITRPKACGAGVPGDIIKGTASGGTGSINLTASGSPASGDTWYWQTSASGTSKTNSTASAYAVSSAGTYYLRSYNTSSDCWNGTTKSVAVAAADLLTAISPTLSYASEVEVGGTINPTLSGNAGSGTVTYALNSVTPAGGLTIDEGTGAVTGVTAGATATVTATITANGNYKGGSATSSTITVADDVCFRMEADASASDELTLNSGESITAGSKNCTTLSGGTAVYRNGASGTMKVQKPSVYGWYFGSNSDSIVITLSGTKLQTGSVITVSCNVGSTTYTLTMNGVTIAQKSGSSGDLLNNEYTVKAGDSGINGKHILVLKRGGGGSVRLYSLSISNCAERETYNVTYYPNGGSGSQATHNVSEVESMSDLGFTRAGYDFTGWKTGATSGTDYAVGDDVTSALTLYAQWECTTPTFDTDLSTTPHVVREGDAAVTLTVAASANSGTVSYQWYSNTSKSTTGATPLTTGATYNAPTSSLGTLYYYCVATNTTGGGCTAQSAYATVTVNEAPCFEFVGGTKAGSGWPVAAGSPITISLYNDVNAVISGGTVVNSGTATIGSNNGVKGLVFDAAGNNAITITLSGTHAFAVGTVITISGASGDDNSSSNNFGFSVNGNNLETTSLSTANAPFEKSYTVAASDGVEGGKTIQIKLNTSCLRKTYLKSVTVTGCADCTPINPTLTYSKTTIWMDEEDCYASATLNTGGSTGTPSYSSSNTDVVYVNSETGFISAYKRGTATITASIPADGTHCAGTATCEITVKDTTCGWTEIASAVLTSKTAATTVNATLLASNMSNSSAPYKLDKTLPSYFGLQLSSGNFQVGDSIIFKVKINDMNISGYDDYPVAFYHSTDTSSYTPASALYTAGGQTKNTDNIYIRFVVSQAMIDAGLTNKILIIRSGRVTQNHSMYEARIKRYGCPDIFIYDDAADNGLWSDANNWLGAAGHGSGLPTSDDRIFIKKSVTVDTEAAAAARVHLTNGNMMTVQKSVTMGTVEVESGSTLNVAKDEDEGITLALNTLYLKGGYYLKPDYSTVYDMPRVYIDPASTMTRTNSTINFDVAVTNQYHPIAVPFPVKVGDVNYVKESLALIAEYGTHYDIRTYDGADRANYGAVTSNWTHLYATEWNTETKKFDDIYLKPGRGYIMAAMRGAGDLFSVIRFPMKNVSNDWTTLGEQGTVDEVTKNVVEVTAYLKDGDTDGTKTPNANKGWNILGVPFMSRYKATDDIIQSPTEVIKGHFNYTTGKWDEDEIRYVTVPTYDFSKYNQYSIEEEGTTLLPGWCFFIQVEESGTLKFLSVSEAEEEAMPIYAPRREQEHKPTVNTGIILTGANAKDKTTILVSDKYSAADYEINADLEKMFGENGYTLATYTLSGETRLAYNAMNNADIMNVIPVGYRAPEEGEYTFSINPRYAESEAFEQVNLMDYEEGVITNLLQSSYSFTTARTQNDARFAINVVKRQDMPTDVENVQGGDAETSKVRKVLINDKMYIIVDGKMYDATGKSVK